MISETDRFSRNSDAERIQGNFFPSPEVDDRRKCHPGRLVSRLSEGDFLEFYFVGKEKITVGLTQKKRDSGAR